MVFISKDIIDSLSKHNNLFIAYECLVNKILQKFYNSAYKEDTSPINKTVKFFCCSNRGLIVEFIIFYNNKENGLYLKSKLIHDNFNNDELRQYYLEDYMDKHGTMLAKFNSNNDDSNSLLIKSLTAYDSIIKLIYDTMLVNETTDDIKLTISVQN